MNKNVQPLFDLFYIKQCFKMRARKHWSEHSPQAPSAQANAPTANNPPHGLHIFHVKSPHSRVWLQPLTRRGTCPGSCESTAQPLTGSARTTCSPSTPFPT